QRMSQQSLERSTAVNHGAHSQHGIEPVAELAGETLEHQVGRKPLLPIRPVRCEPHGAEGDDARVEPRIADVFDAGSQGTALLATNLDGVDERPVRRMAIEDVPAMDGFLFELLPAADHHEVLTRAANPDRQSESPEALLGDHPVAHVAQPVQLARFALRRNPLDGWDYALDAVAPVHADEPLIHRTKHQFRFAAPAVWIDVRIAFARDQKPGGFERRDNVVRHFAGVAARERAEVVDENRAFVQWRDEREAVVFAQVLVLGAAAWSNVDEARAFRLAHFVPCDHAMRLSGLLASAGFAVRKHAARYLL